MPNSSPSRAFDAALVADGARSSVASRVTQSSGWPLASCLRIAVSTVLFAVLISFVDLGAVADVLASARPEYLVATFGLLLLERVFAAWRWFILLRLVEPQVAFWPILRITLISNFVGAFLPGAVGIEVLRVYGLARAAGDLGLALSSVLVERLAGLLSLMILTICGLIIAPIALPLGLELLAAAGLVVLLLVGFCILLPGPRTVAKRLLRGVPMLGLVRAKLVGLEGRFDTYGKRPGALLISLALAVVFQLLRVLSVLVGVIALGIAVDPFVLLVVVPVGIFVALLPISLGGFGPREASYVGLLGVAGVSPPGALALALTREALNLLTTLPGAFLYMRAPLHASPVRTPGSAVARSEVVPAAGQ